MEEINSKSNPNVKQRTDSTEFLELINKTFPEISPETKNLKIKIVEEIKELHIEKIEIEEVSEILTERFETEESINEVKSPDSDEVIDEVKSPDSDEVKSSDSDDVKSPDSDEVKNEVKSSDSDEVKSPDSDEVKSSDSDEVKNEEVKSNYDRKTDFDFKESKKMRSQRFESTLRTLQDEIPETLRFAFDIVNDKLEDYCARIHQVVNSFFNKKKNTFEYALLVVKVMEEIEKIYNVSNTDKFKIAVRCITELLLERSDDIPKDAKKELLQTIPGSIDAFIQLTKYGKVKSNIKGKKLIKDVYIIKRATDRIIKFVKDKDYDASAILTNFFLIVSHGLIVVNAYSLERTEKKEILLCVIREFLEKYRNKDGTPINKTYVKMILDLAPSVIERFFQATDGLFNINNIKCDCFTWCCK